MTTNTSPIPDHVLSLPMRLRVSLWMALGTRIADFRGVSDKILVLDESGGPTL
ncbi:MAG: hypothetical protein AAB263_13250 [Planctomycetota bacterium]